MSPVFQFHKARPLSDMLQVAKAIYFDGQTEGNQCLVFQESCTSRSRLRLQIFIFPMRRISAHSN